MDEMAAAQSMSTCRKGKCILQCSLEFAEEGKYSSFFFLLTFYIFLSLMGEIEAPLLLILLRSIKSFPVLFLFLLSSLLRSSYNHFINGFYISVTEQQKGLCFFFLLKIVSLPIDCSHSKSASFLSFW